MATQRKDAEFELVDIADYKLPLLDERIPPSLGRYEHQHTKTWAEKIASFDAYVFVTPEYNHRFDQLVAWGDALKAVRTDEAQEPTA